MSNRLDRTDLHYAALDNHTASARVALTAGVDPNTADRAGFRPLHLVIQQGAVEGHVHGSGVEDDHRGDLG
jgi:uncharacterized protein